MQAERDEYRKNWEHRSEGWKDHEDELRRAKDKLVSRTVEQAVRSLKAAGKCVLFSTHLLAQAEDICDRIGVIGQGQVLAEGTIPELCALTGTQALRHAFFALADRAEASAPPAPDVPQSLGGFPVVSVRKDGADAP